MQKNQLRLYGILFILTFISYGYGSYFVDHISQINNSINFDDIRNNAVLGSILLCPIHTSLNIAIVVLMFNNIYVRNKVVSLFYLIFGCLATIYLSIGGLFILSINSLHEFNQIVISHCLELNNSLYQFGMIFWGISGISLVFIFIKHQLINISICIGGLIGYALLIIGNFFDLLQIGNYGTILSLPGGLFEILISLLLIFLNKFSDTKEVV